MHGLFSSGVRSHTFTHTTPPRRARLRLHVGRVELRTAGARARRCAAQLRPSPAAGDAAGDGPYIHAQIFGHNPVWCRNPAAPHTLTHCIHCTQRRRTAPAPYRWWRPRSAAAGCTRVSQARPRLKKRQQISNSMPRGESRQHTHADTTKMHCILVNPGAVTADGRLYMWGRGDNGQLGVGRLGGEETGQGGVYGGCIGLSACGVGGKGGNVRGTKWIPTISSSSPTVNNRLPGAGGPALLRVAREAGK